MKNELRQQLYNIMQNLYPEIDLALDSIELSCPLEQFGDYSSNIAMKLAGKLKKNPMEVAEQIKKEIEKSRNDGFERIEIAKPGFLNFFVSQKQLWEILNKVIFDQRSYGQSQIGKGKQVMVEFGQPNTHKAFHVGHLRSAISGLAVVNLFEALGYKVIKANYFGDVGMHVAKTTWAMSQAPLPADFSLWDKHRKMQLIDQKYAEGSAAFKENPQAQEEIRQINKDIYDKKSTEQVELYKSIRQWSLEQLDDIFKSLGVEYDRQYPESEVFPDTYDIIKKNIGTLFSVSQGAIIFDGSQLGLTTWVFLTREGVPTYSAKDLALALKKFSEYDLDLAIVTTSVEQIDYFRVIIYCLEKIKPELKGKYVHVPFGWLLKGHKKTSSRMGDTIKGVEILEEARKVSQEKITVAKEYNEEIKNQVIDKVAMSGLKFLILSHEFHNNINYDPNEFIRLKGYSGPFILYSYVRTQSILKKVGQPEFQAQQFASLKQTPEERELMNLISRFPDVVEQAALEIAPHQLCNYLYKLAQKFNIFYEKCPIQMAETPEIKNSRLLISKATGQVLKNGLAFLGIETTEVM